MSFIRRLFVRSFVHRPKSSLLIYLYSYNHLLFVLAVVLHLHPKFLSPSIIPSQVDSYIFIPTSTYRLHPSLCRCTSSHILFKLIVIFLFSRNSRLFSLMYAVFITCGAAAATPDAALKNILAPTWPPASCESLIHWLRADLRMASRPISHSPWLVAGMIFVMSSGPACGAAIASPDSPLKNRLRLLWPPASCWSFPYGCWADCGTGTGPIFISLVGWGYSPTWALGWGMREVVFGAAVYKST